MQLLKRIRYMKVVDLFSGIGGFSLGLERAGMETIAFCEFDKHAQKVLKKHWPDIPIHDDIRTLDARQYRGTVSVVCGGFPCQPYSVAGKQLGGEDDRDLWHEMLRIIDESRPSWVVGENSFNVLNMAFGKIKSDLEGIGYEVGEPLEIPACAINADHRRKRAWICAHANDVGLQGGGKKALSRLARLPLEPPGVFPTERSRSRISEPRNLRSYNGLPQGMDRIKRLGNAVVPQIPEAIGRAIMAVHHPKLSTEEKE